MNINYEKCKKIISLLDSYFQDEGSIAEVEYPSSVVYGSNDYFLYMFYSCLLDYGMRSKIYHRNLIDTYMQYPYIFNPDYVIHMPEEEIKSILIHHVHPRYPNIAVKKWMILSQVLVKYDCLLDYLKSLESFSSLEQFIKSISGYGQKTGGLLIRIICDSKVCNFKEDLAVIPIDRHDIEISYFTGIIDSKKLNQKDIRRLSDIYIMLGKELTVDASTIDKYLWEVGNNFCNKRKCSECPLKEICSVSKKGEIIMNILFREVQIDDKEFILEAHKEINRVSGLSESHFSENIDKDLFQDRICKVIVAELDGERAGFLLYSYLYFADSGRGIYLSQAYVKDEYRKQGILRQMLEELEAREKECSFIMDFVGRENKVMMRALGKLGFTSSDMITYYRKIRK